MSHRNFQEVEWSNEPFVCPHVKTVNADFVLGERRKEFCG